MEKVATKSTTVQDTKVLQFSSLTSHYWDNGGLWRNVMSKLNRLIPATGSADTLNGELVRSVNRLYYDYCNNGNINARRIEYGCDEYGDWDEDDIESISWDISWDPYFGKFYELIESVFKGVRKDLDTDDAFQIVMALDKVNELVTSEETDDEFSDLNMNAYDVLVDFVAWYCTNYPDKPLPYWYSKG